MQDNEVQRLLTAICIALGATMGTSFRKAFIAQLRTVALAEEDAASPAAAAMLRQAAQALEHTTGGSPPSH
jgi:hypothetical protein